MKLSQKEEMRLQIHNEMKTKNWIQRDVGNGFLGKENNGEKRVNIGFGNHIPESS